MYVFLINSNVNQLLISSTGTFVIIVQFQYRFLMKFTRSAAKAAAPKHYLNPGNLSSNNHLTSKSSLVKILEASQKMKILALALLAFTISANASSISCGPSKTDCKEPEPVELCTYQKTSV